MLKSFSVWFPGLLLIIVLLAGPAAQAEVIVVSEQKKTFRPSEGDIPPLREFSLLEMKKLIRLPGDPIMYQTYATDVRMILKTASVVNIEDFLVVQYIKGCLFESDWDGRTLRKHLRIARHHLGQTKTFRHTDWEVDNDGLDPAYSSYESLGRYALWRWNKNPNSFDPEKATWYANAKAPHPVIYLTDLPGGASRHSDFQGLQEARNTSLEFQTCLFHARDVPESVDSEGKGPDRNRAIICHEWDHKFVYEFRRGEFASPHAIDPVCL